MDIFAIGLNLETASVEELESCFISKNELKSSLLKLKESAELNELVILSTCNRVEVYGVTNNIEKTTSAIESFFVEKSGLPTKQLLGLFFKFIDHQALEHLFKVASSINSLVIGESQILGQVKQAYEDALSYKYTGKIINRLFHNAITLGKRIRTETDLGKKQVSIASVGVKLASNLFSDLSDKTVLLIGAGEMAERTAFLLVERRIKAIHIYNRNLSRAAMLAQKYNAGTVSNIHEGLVLSDIVISSTSSQEFIIKKEHILEAFNVCGERPMFLIDIAIPRDVDPEVRSIKNIHLFNIDDLREIAEDNKKEREKEIELAMAMIKKEVASFLSWIHFLSVEPMIKDLTAIIETLCENEISKNYKRLMIAESKDIVVRALAKSLTKKILHNPITVIRKNTMTDNDHCIETARRLFKLEE